jgi:cobalt-precorrin 5A hydrolase
MGPTLAETFTRYDCHVHVISVGAVVRMVAPLLANKKVDPAIICVDDAARFSISVLSGHVGRGNAFCERVAAILDAAPVVTTASDARGTLTVDILGRDLGWTLDDPDRNVTRGCAAVVNEAPVAFVQECGEPHFWGPLPPNVQYFTSLEDVDPKAYEILLVVSDRELRETHPAHFANAVVYRPRTLVVGLGCDKLTPSDLVARGLRTLLAKHNLSPKSVARIATIDLKRDEPALNALGLPMVTYSARELDAVPVPTPSETVKRHVGTRGVAEPAALLAAGGGALVVPKQVYTEMGAGRSLTLAVARLSFPGRAA